MNGVLGEFCILYLFITIVIMHYVFKELKENCSCWIDQALTYVSIYFSGMLQMLMDTELDVTQQDYVRTAQASGKALVSLINEVLDQAKIESGKLELEAVPFDMRAILDDVLSLFSGKSQEKGLEVINIFLVM